MADAGVIDQELGFCQSKTQQNKTKQNKTKQTNKQTNKQNRITRIKQLNK
jgi:hypothetical protein